MSTTLTVVTQVYVATRRREPLRLSPLLRHALQTARAQPRADGRPLLLPTTIPARCAHDLFACRAAVRWRVGDGRNRVFFCQDHIEELWEAGHEVKDFEVERWVP